jgi:EmrB/QacA subfamily drug resistance transporter
VVVQYALLAGPLLSMVDSSIVNVAVEPIARQLHTPLTTVQWAVSGYLLAMGTGLAATSYLARRAGTLTLCRASLIAFTLASAACAAAPGVDMLVAARVVQGLAGAPLVPLAMSMMLGSGDTTRSISPLAGILLFLGPALGPSVGGALIAVAGWRTIFLINVPIGAVAAVSATRIPAALAPGRDEAARFDLPGLLLLAVGLTLLLLGASQGGLRGWSAPASWLPLAAGAALLAGYAGWGAHRDHPALDLSLLRNRGCALALLLCAAASVVTYSTVFLLPVFVQSVQGHSAPATGLAMLPAGVITGVSTVLGQRLLGRVSVRATVLAGFTVLAVASLGLLAIGAHTPLAVTAVILAARAASIGLVITPLLTVLLRWLAPGQLADANTLFSIWQRIAGSFGVGVIAALFAAQARQRGPVAGLHVTGMAIAAVAAIAAIAAVALPPIRNTAFADR